MTRCHQTVFIELPVLIAVGSKPVSRIVMTFISEANGDPIALKRPQFLDQPVIDFPRPFAPKKGDNLLPADEEFGPVAPPALFAVGKSHLFRITRIPSVFRKADFLNGGFVSEWGQWRTRQHMLLLVKSVCDCIYGKVARPSVLYGERQRPEPWS